MKNTKTFAFATLIAVIIPFLWWHFVQYGSKPINDWMHTLPDTVAGGLVLATLMPFGFLLFCTFVSFANRRA